MTEMSMESLCQALLTSPHTQTRDFILIALVFFHFLAVLCSLTDVCAHIDEEGKGGAPAAQPRAAAPAADLMDLISGATATPVSSLSVFPFFSPVCE